MTRGAGGREAWWQSCSEEWREAELRQGDEGRRTDSYLVHQRHVCVQQLQLVKQRRLHRFLLILDASRA